MPAGARPARPRGQFGLVDKATLGLTDSDKSFEQYYEKHGVPTYRDGDAKVAHDPRRIIRQDAAARKLYEDWCVTSLKGMAAVRQDNNVEKAKDEWTKWLDSKGDLVDAGYRKAILKTMDAAQVGVPSADGAVPLVYDPEVIDIFRRNAPLVDRIPFEGQAGFKAAANRITSRGGPIGWTSESDSADLTDNSASDAGLGQVEKEMEILVDMIEVTDFAQMASESAGPLDLRETTLGTQLAGLVRHRAMTILYGDNSNADGDGGPGDSDAPDGVETDIADNNASNKIDKSSTDINGVRALAEDIKSEINAFRQQNRAVDVGDLICGTSWTVFNLLEDEFQSNVTTDQDGQIRFGRQAINIAGVPVVPTHNVDEETSFATNFGDEGDVFLINTRSARYRQLMPMTTIPLAQHGFAEMIGIGEFAAPILRANGEFCKKLDAYPVSALTGSN